MMRWWVLLPSDTVDYKYVVYLVLQLSLSAIIITIRHTAGVEESSEARRGEARRELLPPRDHACSHLSSGVECGGC